jgi:hypothetical protein
VPEAWSLGSPGLLSFMLHVHIPLITHLSTVMVAFWIPYVSLRPAVSNCLLTTGDSSMASQLHSTHL